MESQFIVGHFNWLRVLSSLVGRPPSPPGMCVTVNAHSPEHCGTLSLSMTDITHGRTSRWLLWIPYGNVAWPISRAVHLWNCCRGRILCTVTLPMPSLQDEASLRTGRNNTDYGLQRSTIIWIANCYFLKIYLYWNLQSFLSQTTQHIYIIHYTFA